MIALKEDRLRRGTDREDQKLVNESQGLSRIFTPYIGSFYTRLIILFV